jgi:hypothetical protein
MCAQKKHANKMRKQNRGKPSFSFFAHTTSLSVDNSRLPHGITTAERG